MWSLHLGIEVRRTWKKNKVGGESCDRFFQYLGSSGERERPSCRFKLSNKVSKSGL